MYSFVYDLDGTLISTREANWRAYREIGVQPPDNFHQVHWDTWCKFELHDKKNEVLPNFTQYMKRMPMWAFALQNPGYILSMCSHPAKKLIMERFPELNKIGDIENDMSSEQRINWLNLNKAPYPQFYFDDNPEFCKLAATKTEWQICQIYP